MLRAPDAVTRTIAVAAIDRERRWLLRRPRSVRRSFVAEVIDRGGSAGAQRGWMLAAGRRRARVLRRRGARAGARARPRGDLAALPGRARCASPTSPRCSTASRLRALVAAEPTTGPPDFIGVGTQRSGTTWWFQTLLGHPQIRPPRGRRKELHFFDRFCRAGAARRRHRRLPRAVPAQAGPDRRRVDAALHARLLDAAAARARRAGGEAADHVPRPDRALPLGRAAPAEQDARTRASRRSPPTRSSAVATRRSCAALLACHDESQAADPAVREVRRRPGGAVPPHARLPRRRRRAPARRLRAAARHDPGGAEEAALGRPDGRPARGAWSRRCARSRR